QRPGAVLGDSRGAIEPVRWFGPGALGLRYAGAADRERSARITAIRQRPARFPTERTRSPRSGVGVPPTGWELHRRMRNRPLPLPVTPSVMPTPPGALPATPHRTRARNDPPPAPPPKHRAARSASGTWQGPRDQLRSATSVVTGTRRCFRGEHIQACALCGDLDGT